MKNRKAIIAVDFDGTIAHTSYPVIHEPFPLVKEALSSLKENGCYIIIWTCRHGKELEEAIEFLNNYNIPYDLVNTQHPELIKIFNNDTRKISCDIYIDDKCLFSLKNKPFPNWRSITREVLNIINHKGFTSILNYNAL